MPQTMTRLTIAAVLTTLAATPLPAQTEAAKPDPSPLMDSFVDASGYVTAMFTQAAEQMSEEDYAFKPTPEVRSFGQILAHVADSSYLFCARAKGEAPPAGDIETTKTTKAEIQKALSESLAYCDGVLAEMTDEQANATAESMGKARPVLAILMFRAHHSLLHYGNVITYMRLRGKVPPSTAGQLEE